MWINGAVLIKCDCINQCGRH